MVTDGSELNNRDVKLYKHDEMYFLVLVIDTFLQNMLF